ncbi:MAG: 5-dehydro-4-deoxy-D-glucuronate isomerase [Bacteroidota bacterium]
MNIRYIPNQAGVARMTTEELRSTFVVDNLFDSGKISLTYVDADRAIIGSAVPESVPLKLESSKKEMAADYFCERREIGIVNIGNDGTITADGKEYRLANKELLYIGRGAKEIKFSSSSASNPAKFFLISYPAHKEYPTTYMPRTSANVRNLGSQSTANTRTLSQFIHENGVKSSQLVMGYTELADGNIWNTMPPHTHLRRSEIYMYFDLQDDNIVVHLMGEPKGTKSLILRNGQAVISPTWSVHCGAGTSKYTFVWAMGGENQAFDDMDAAPLKELL